MNKCTTTSIHHFKQFVPEADQVASMDIGQCFIESRLFLPWHSPPSLDEEEPQVTDVIAIIEQILKSRTVCLVGRQQAGVEQDDPAAAAAEDTVSVQ